MELRNMLSVRAAVLGFLAAAVKAQSSGLSQEYCSSENTGASYAEVYNMYQSNGACKTQCQGSWAFAIVQDTLCWCSNYIPDTTVDVSECSDKCPGYPSDLCGNLSAGLYGYIPLTIAPLGIYGAAKSTASATASSSSTPQSSSSQLQTGTVSQTIVQTVTQAGGATTVVSYVTIPDSSTTSSSSTSSTTSTAALSTQVVTVSGAVITQTVTATPVSSSGIDSSAFQTQQQNTGLSGGAIAGIVIGVVAALAIIALGAFLLYRRRRQQEQEAAVAAAAAGMSEKPAPRRNTSVLSKSGLLGGATMDHHEQLNPFDEPANAGTTSQRHSLLFGAGGLAAEGVSPVSPLEPTNSGDSRRHSRPMVYDQRLNPSALFASHDNGSRVSMQDGADYSRTLGVTNPDPRASWESRVSRGA